MRCIGIEISPASSHSRVKTLKDKTTKKPTLLKDVNIELAKSWNKETSKRNDYFKRFGITTITFSDDDLADLDGCFKEITFELSRRARKIPTVADQIGALKRFPIR